KAFLRFVVVKALDNQDVSLKEYTIATEVFGRHSNYDPHNDSIVRVQASRLRSKLQEYYKTEGKRDKIIIELPKGGYLPTFSYAPTIDEIAEPVPAVDLRPKEPAANPISSLQPVSRSSGLKLAVGAMAILTLFFVAT